MSASDMAARLPGIETVRNWSRSLAVLDAILSPEWQYRYFSFDPAWGEGEELASMRNGSGDEYSIVFESQGAFIRGFDHESPLSPWAQDPPGVVAGLLDGVPDVFEDQLVEPAFSMDGILAVTVCIWREDHDSGWHVGRVSDPRLSDQDDGASWLFEVLDGKPESYVAFAQDYYERAVPLASVSHVFQGRTLTADIIAALNSEAEHEEVLREARQLGYPVGA